MDSLNPEKGADYRQLVQRRIKELELVIDQAAAGNLSGIISDPSPSDEFSNLYASVTQILAITRDKISRLEKLNCELEDIVAARSSELYGSETKYTAVANTANDAIITIDALGNVNYMNRAAEIIFGRPFSAVNGKLLTMIIPGLEPNYLTVLQAPPYKTSKKVRKLVEAIAKYKGGREFPVELSFATWQVGRKTYITAIVRDLTVHQMLVRKLGQKTEQLEGRVAEQTKLLRQQLAAAEHSQAQNAALLGSIGEGVVAMNKAGRIFFANREFARFTGVGIDQVKNRHYYSGLKLVDEAGVSVPRSSRPIYQSLQTGKRTFSSDYFYKSADGRLIPVAITAAPIIIKNKIIGVIDVIRDITKEKAADQIKSDFVSLASHQLRTPATAVKGLISLLIEGYSGTLDPNQLAHLQQAFIENEHELELVDDMLDVAKFDAGEVVLENSRFDVVGLIDIVVAEQRVMVQSRNQTISITAPKTVYARADSDKLRMVFENLITNASKYSADNGHIGVNIDVSKKSIIVSVTDNGIGIAKKDISQLFKRFSRIDNPTTRHITGSGLGLYLTKKIVDLHNGEISVESTPGRGSVFVVNLPILIKE